MRISELDLKLARAARFPTVDFNTGYNFTFADTPSAAITYNRSQGFNWGFSLSWTLFSGFDVNRRIKNAKLEVKGSELNYQQIENNVMSELALLYNTYERNLLMINFEIESVETAFQTLDAAMSRYKVGSLSGIEFREYQKSYLEAVDRKFNAMYQAKLSEINLRILGGELVMADEQQ
jgi:outer membrane protein TolC